MGQVTIEMSPATVEGLSAQGSTLVAMKAVKALGTGGVPLVWLATNSFSASNVVAWNSQFQAFSSPGPIVVGGTLPAAGTAPIGLGQAATIQSDLSLDVVGGQLGDAMLIDNQSGNECVGAFGQSVSGSPNPLCAFPIPQPGLVLIYPIEIVFLAITSIPITLGMVLEANPGPSMTVDLTENPSRTVVYDINLGWAWGGAAWGKAVYPNLSNLSSLMILSDGPNPLAAS